MLVSYKLQSRNMVPSEEVQEGLNRIHWRHMIGASYDERDRCIAWVTTEGAGVGFVERTSIGADTLSCSVIKY
jgi:hypothetical protein